MTKQNQTSILNEDSPALHRNLYQQSNSPRGTSTLGQNHEVVLLIRGLPERLVFKDNTEYLLGRFDMNTQQDNEFDLTTYGGSQRGVSRKHAKLTLNGDNLYITDLNSTNGTYVGGERLEANQPTLIHKGDEVILGRLQIQILFR